MYNHSLSHTTGKASPIPFFCLFSLYINHRNSMFAQGGLSVSVPKELSWLGCKTGAVLGNVRLTWAPNGLQAQKVIPVAASQSSGEKWQASHRKWTSPFLDLVFFFAECKGLPCPAFFRIGYSLRGLSNNLLRGAVPEILH